MRRPVNKTRLAENQKREKPCFLREGFALAGAGNTRRLEQRVVWSKFWLPSLLRRKIKKIKLVREEWLEDQVRGCY